MKCSLKEAIEEYKNEECSEFPYDGEEFEYFVFGITEERDEDSLTPSFLS